MSTDNSFPYKALYELSLILHQQNSDTRKTMQTLLAKAGEIVGLKRGFLITFNKDDSIHGAYLLDKTSSSTDDGAQMWETLLDRGLVGFVYHGHRTVHIRNIQTDARWPAMDEIPGALTHGSAIGIPLSRGTTVFGVMMFVHDEVDYFSGEISTVLEEIAELGATAINNAWDYDISGKASIRYQTLFDDAVVPMLLTDLNGSIVSVNRKASDLLGYDRHELLLKPIRKINRIDLESLSGGLNKLKVDEEITLRSTAHNRAGDEIPVLLRVRRLGIGDGNLVEWVQQDMTAQMQLEQLRRDLSAMVYHDLRGPLQGISGSIQKLAQVVANHENPAVRTLLQIGIRSTRQLRRMIDSLLDVQRLEEGSAILDLNPIEMRVVLTDAIQLVQPIAHDAKQKLSLDVEKSLPLIEVDSDMILRVIINLIENAIKYTPAGGVITLRAGLDTDTHCIRVSVRDSGPGIPQELRESIFDKFNRIKQRNGPQGVGLGLAFCRLAVTAHGGNIWVESKDGQGSEFIFTLPLESSSKNSDLIAELMTSA